MASTTGVRPTTTIDSAGLPITVPLKEFNRRSERTAALVAAIDELSPFIEDLEDGLPLVAEDLLISLAAVNQLHIVADKLREELALQAATTLLVRHDLVSEASGISSSTLRRRLSGIQYIEGGVMGKGGRWRGVAPDLSSVPTFDKL